MGSHNDETVSDTWPDAWHDNVHHPVELKFQRVRARDKPGAKLELRIKATSLKQQDFTPLLVKNFLIFNLDY